MTRLNFVRRDAKRYSKLGKNRKKLLRWVRPKGRDNKMRERRVGYPQSVRVGFKKSKKESGKIKNLNPVLVYNANDLTKVSKDNIVIIGNIGARKKIEVIKKAREMKLQIYNLREVKG